MMIDRRALLVLASGLDLMATASLAQPQRSTPLRVGWLSPGTREGQLVLVEQLRKGLQELGYVEGRNLLIEMRFGDGRADRLQPLAQELARLKPDAIVTAFGPTAVAAKQVIADIPVVFTLVGAPKDLGVVRDLARPGGNVTGLSSVNIDLAQKRLELLRELVPKARRVAFIYSPSNVVDRAKLEQARTAAARLGIDVIPIETERDQYVAAFERAVKADVHAATVTFNADSFDMRRQIVGAAASRKLPVVYEMRAFVDEGGLLSYSVNQYAQIARAARYVDRIARGTKPGDLPVEEPVTLEAVVNLKAARAVGVIVPDSVMIRADSVIR